MPFVLHSQPTAVFEPQVKPPIDEMAAITQRRYLEIMRDVEEMINDHSEMLAAALSIKAQN